MEWKRMSRSTRLSGLATLLVILGLVAPAVRAQGKWLRLAPFPQPAEEILGAVANGKLYVFAGLVSAPIWTPIGMVYEYDPATDRWTKKKPMAFPAHHVAFTEYHGKIYAFGGFVAPESGPAAWVPINNAWEYDPAADTWKALAPMPIKRGSPVAAAVGDKIYVIGGATTPPGSNQISIDMAHEQVGLGTVQEYDPATNTWRERSPMPTARNHMAVGVVNGKIYVIGGRVGAAFIAIATDVSAVEEYDPATDHWKVPRARMPTARSALAAGVYDGRIYVAGGEFQDPHMMATFKVVEAYDPASDSWVEMPPMPVSRHGLAGGVIGNRLYLVGGDVQSSGTGISVSTAEHDAFEFAGGSK
jgi:N-acetylneuraminic acid mutarotase